MRTRAYQLKKMTSEPPKNAHELTPSQLLTDFKTKIDWSIVEFGDAVAEFGGPASSETIKKWLQNDTIPSGVYRKALLNTVAHYCDSDKNKKAWGAAIENCWGNWRSKKKAKTSGRKIASPGVDIHKEIRKRSLSSPWLTRLPSLFETDQALSLADTYVDLRILPSPRIEANPQLLDQALTLSEALIRRNHIRFTSMNKDPKDLLDKSDRHSMLIIGPPGSGKSSLLRRVALSIASDEWNKVTIPLFIEARTYWEQRKTHESLLAFALRQLFPNKKDFDELLEHLLGLQKNGERTVLLLVDGLDEIASRPNAWKTISNELINIASTVNWVATCRPTGLLSGLGETLRCEMVELDDLAIETLIENWCRSIACNETSIDFKKLEDNLKNEVLGSNNLREMARNPFLLSSLCFLKTQKSDLALPKTRISVYEMLLRCIAWQAQRRYNDRNILSGVVLKHLQAFLYFLYSHKKVIIQVFQEELWNEFNDEADESSVDFHAHILPSRLLTSMGEVDPHYHFLHLSLQEYLIAKHLIAQHVPISEILEKRFIPAWRSVFRFYAGLLFQEKKLNEFRGLVQKLYSEVDINCISLIMLTEIFVDVGIQDTHEWIGKDLRKQLYEETTLGSGWRPQEVVNQALLDALAMLDPVWLGNTLMHKINRLRDSQRTRQVMQDMDYFFGILCRVKTPTVYGYIKDAFNHENHHIASSATFAYSQVATRLDRQVLTGDIDRLHESEEIHKIINFIESSRREEFIPFLKKVVNSFFETDKDEYMLALSMIANIGGQQAEQFLHENILREAHRTQDNFNRFEDALSAVEELGGEGAVQILNRLLVYPEIYISKDISTKIIVCNPSNDETIIHGLERESSRNSIIAALYTASAYNRPVCDNVAAVLSRYLNVASDEDVTILSSIELTRIRTGRSPLLCDLLLESARKMIHRILDSLSPEAANNIVFKLSGVFEVMGRGRWEPAKEHAKTWLFDSKLRSVFFPDIVNLVGALYMDSKQTDVVDLLKEFVFDEVYAQFINLILLAIGRIDLEALNRLRGSYGGKHALGEIAAETGIIIFNKFWVNPAGECTNWINPPLKIYLARSDGEQEMVDLIGHELSQYGFWLDPNTSKNSVAVLTYCSSEKHIKKTLSSEKDWDACENVFNIPNHLSKAEINSLANTIGIGLAEKIKINNTT